MHAISRSFRGLCLAATVALSLSPALAQHAHTPTPATAAPILERYYCPMHCEGARVYPKPGKCPVCKMALKKQTTMEYSATIREASDGGHGDLVAGKPASLLISIKDPTGLAVTGFETSHEKTLHLLVVSKDLSWFRHEHPAKQADGSFTAPFTFPHGGDFLAYLDFTPTPSDLAEVRQQVVKVPLTIDGKPAPAIPLVVDAATPKVIDGYTIALDTGKELRAGASATLSFSISKDKAPVTTLAPYLGAFGHLVVLSEDGSEFVHSHPIEAGKTGVGGPTVAFGTRFAKPGTYKAWGQFNVGSKDHEQILTVPFVFKVEPGEAEHPGHGADDKHHEHAK